MIWQKMRGYYSIHHVLSWILLSVKTKIIKYLFYCLLSLFNTLINTFLSPPISMGVKRSGSVNIFLLNHQRSEMCHSFRTENHFLHRNNIRGHYEVLYCRRALSAGGRSAWPLILLPPSRAAVRTRGCLMYYRITCKWYSYPSIILGWLL